MMKVHKIRNIGILTNSFDIEKTLGKGANGIVYRARRKSDDKVFALKEIDYRYTSGASGPTELPKATAFLQTLEKTFDIMKMLSAPSEIGGPGCHLKIVCYYDLFLAEKEQPAHTGYPPKVYVYVLMQYIKGQTIEDLVRELNHKHLPTDQMIKYMRDVMSAVSYIHFHSIAHLDLKSENIVFGDDELYIIDFDFACSVKYRPEIKVCKEAKGTPAFISPELYLLYQRKVEKLPLDAYLKSDIWSLGIMFLEMALGTFIDDLPQPDFQDMIGDEERDTLNEYLALIVPPHIPDYIGIDPLIAQVINSMLTVNYKVRPSAQDILDMLYSA